ncbi:hypothetical protein Q1695_009702 [Nippostrongylus brasiliensis]|nr:hypothetical protein Q1695_009702 [Nippostrongylus brasiliensis]
MSCSRDENVLWRTVAFLTLLQLTWAIWSTVNMITAFIAADVHIIFFVLLALDALTWCASFASKAYALKTRTIDVERSATFALVAVVIFHAAYCLVVMGFANAQFGLHFYYDVPAISATTSALDLALFPHVVGRKREESIRKQR